MVGRHVIECGMCDRVFRSKADLRLHIMNHEEPKTSFKCEVCNWEFDVLRAFERHKIQSGHMIPQDQFFCNKCNLYFTTVAKLDQHRQFPSKCSDAFQTTRQRNSAPSLAEPDDTFGLPDYIQTARPAATPSVAVSIATQTSKDGNVYCQVCTKSFPSMARYNNHFLGCRPPVATKQAPVFDRQENQSATPVDTRLPKTPDVVGPVRVEQYAGTGHTGGYYASFAAPATENTARVQDSELLRTAAKPTAVEHGAGPAGFTRRRESSQKNGSAAAIEAVAKQGHNAFKGAKKPGRKSSITKPGLRAPNQGHANLADSHPPNSAIGELSCDVPGCGRTLNSEKAMTVHKADAHGIGGKGLDLYGKDSWMLSQKEREQAKQQGLLNIPGPRPALTQKRGNAPMRRPHPSAFSQQVTSLALQEKRAPPPSMPAIAEVATGSNVPGPGPEDTEQAENVAGKIIRLTLQADVIFQHDGKFTYDGIGWRRIPVLKQADIVPKFDELCHLPSFMEGDEFVPAPVNLKDDYDYYNPVAEFETSPVPSPNNPGLRVVAVTCSKIKMANGCLEAVKIAAVDVATCRILLSHLVFGEPSVPVQNWNTEVTGLRGLGDLETARQQGYRIFKGWKAARAALWKFIDKETILVGHNLRADLDSLRIIHGRAVDVAKVFETAASGPLSRQQLSLESMCRGLLEKDLPSDPQFGRDALMNAFAARELALFRIKHNDKWVRWAKTKSLEYQRIAPVPRD